MLKDEIKKDIVDAAKNIGLELGKLDVEVVRTSDPRFGDFTTNIALRFAQGKLPSVSDAKSFDKAQDKQSPMEFAKLLSQSLQKQPYIKKLEVVRPGFVNFFIKDEIWQKEVENVLKENIKYGSNTLGKGKAARVEFVSANPTGPLHFGNARGGPIGDSLASVLEFSGYKVVREYLHNDVGVQVAKLGESIVKVASGKKLEDQEYKGEYIKELAGQVQKSKIKNQKSKITSEEAGQKAVAILLDEILKDCGGMGIKFDEVYPEGDFAATGATEKILKTLNRKRVLRKQDGALWFAPSDEFLKDRETVVKKSDGSYTYFANDIAYHNLKFAQNPALVIDVLGANHHGHVPRLQAVVKALGYDVSRFHVILYQWVRFRRRGELVKMSKRSGTFVTAGEVLSEIGRDALRFFILMHDASSPIDFDLDLAREKSSKNPVYYVQYAHARIASILRSSNSKFEIRNSKLKPNFQLLKTEYELALIKQIARLPEVIEDIAGNFAVHRLTAYSIGLADSFHKFYENCRVIPARNASPARQDGVSGGHSDAGGGEDRELELARLDLITATKIVLVNTLSLLGVSAPEKM